MQLSSITMFRLLLVSAIVALAAGAAPRVRPVVPMLDGRIVGGKETTIEARPYQLSLQFLDSHICGASLISENRALTAAHCTDGNPAWILSVRAGSANRASGGVVVDVSSIAQHKNYNSAAIDYDVSVLILASNLPLGPTIQTVKLHAVGQSVATGTLCTVSGWGTLSSGSGSLPTILQEVDVPKVTQDACKEAYGSSSITDRMLCHGYPQGEKDSCQGDSGGPLVCDGVQTGVVSWGAGCASAGYPGVYAAISNQEINDHITSS